MNKAKLVNTIFETTRFLRIAERALTRLDTDKCAHMGSKETAACRRASLDLTRSLAELRVRRINGSS